MNKIMSFGLLALSIGILGACSSDTGKESKEGTITSESVKKEKKLTLVLNAEELTTDIEGKVIITGKTSPNSTVSAGSFSVSSDSEGAFFINYALSGVNETKLSVTSVKGKQTVKQPLIIKPSQEMIDKKNKENAEKEAEAKAKLEAEAKAKAEAEAKAKAKAEADAKAKADAEIAKAQAEANKKDITKLAETPTLEQATILRSLANQQFEQQFPYKGSKMHSVLGVIQNWTKLDDQWYYKVQATIVNAFGAKRDATIEIRITPQSSDSGLVYIDAY